MNSVVISTKIYSTFVAIFGYLNQIAESLGFAAVQG